VFAGAAALLPRPNGAVANGLWLGAVGASMAAGLVITLAVLRTPELVELAETVRRRVGRAGAP